MCGISGILLPHRDANARLADDRQQHRGPDDVGQYVDPECRARLYFRRLAIIDLTAAGNQPMSNEDGSVWLVYNGEIYNHRELRAELERKGHVFQSRTDSEVLVHLWEEEGRDMLRRLNGMFAFCIWDARTGEAFLARDHAGIKPLYVTRLRDGAIAFASEAKVLLSIPQVSRAIDPVALSQYLTFLWVPGRRTMWRDIEKLPAGGWMSWRQGRVQEGTWWDWDQSETDYLPPDEWARRLRLTMLETIERQRVADVPIGLLLSGGLDSTAVGGAMRQVAPREPIRAYTAIASDESFDGFANDLPYAREAAAHLGAGLVEEALAPSITSVLPRLVWHSDEPLADPAIAASYLLCKRARQDGTVVLLSGQGADELYHGYRSHRAVRLAGRLAGVPSPLVRTASALLHGLAGQSGLSAYASPRRMMKLLRFMGARNAERILQLSDWGSDSLRSEILTQAALRETPTDVYGDYLELFERSRAHTDEGRWSYVLFKTFMPALNLTYGDRTSMAVSVELRVPYLDRALVEQAARIPVELKQRNGVQKWVLAAAASPWIPRSILSRPKTGFGAPLREWMAGDLRHEMRRVLESDRFRARGLFRADGVRTLMRDVETGRRDVAYIVWALFTFELWARTFIDADGAAPIEHVT